MAIKVNNTTVIDDSRNITTSVGTVDGRNIAEDGSKLDGIATGATNTVGNATHTGEVTGSGALTIANNVVDEAKLKVSNSPTNGYMLTAQSGNTGGLTWAEAGGSVAAHQAIGNTLYAYVAYDSPTHSNGHIKTYGDWETIAGTTLRIGVSDSTRPSNVSATTEVATTGPGRCSYRQSYNYFPDSYNDYNRGGNALSGSWRSLGKQQAYTNAYTSGDSYYALWTPILVQRVS